MIKFTEAINRSAEGESETFRKLHLKSI